ncbi:hypothetical protein [uncultured Fusobacterium sp.]|uniref:hypothetical protein n=1 Tax=uncultured Fusobacterium sp. TaxID=159267 RepID=UPI0025FBC0F6|nr:hypothetical protein [uncultured Fusobacterium sp.]
MKRIISFLLFLTLVLVGCTSDEDYINTTKSITFANGQTVEQYIDNNIKAGEMYKLNDSSLFMNEGILFLMNFGSKDEIIYLLEQGGVTIPENITSTKWEIEGETKDGKVVIASNDNIRVKIETVKNGDYIEVSTDKILTYDKASNKMITQEELNGALELYNLALKHGYSNSNKQIEYKRFDEQAVLENKDGVYTLEYYPSGRVKYLSDDIMIYLELEDRSYIKEIAESLVYLDGEIEKYTDESINKFVDFSYELEYKIIAEKLNKKITEEDKKQIQKLEEKANKVFDKLQNQVDKISQN